MKEFDPSFEGVLQKLHDDYIDTSIDRNAAFFIDSWCNRLDLDNLNQDKVNRIYNDLLANQNDIFSKIIYTIYSLIIEFAYITGQKPFSPNWEKIRIGLPTRNNVFDALKSFLNQRENSAPDETYPALKNVSLSLISLFATSLSLLDNYFYDQEILILLNKKISEYIKENINRCHVRFWCNKITFYGVKVSSIQQDLQIIQDNIYNQSKENYEKISGITSINWNDSFFDNTINNIFNRIIYFTDMSDSWQDNLEQLFKDDVLSKIDVRGLVKSSALKNILKVSPGKVKEKFKEGVMNNVSVIAVTGAVVVAVTTALVLSSKKSRIQSGRTSQTLAPIQEFPKPDTKSFLYLVFRANSSAISLLNEKYKFLSDNDCRLLYKECLCLFQSQENESSLDSIIENRDQYLPENQQSEYNVVIFRCKLKKIHEGFEKDSFERLDAFLSLGNLLDGKIKSSHILKPESYGQPCFYC